MILRLARRVWTIADRGPAADEAAAGRVDAARQAAQR